jgi:DNA invertase Pin-like site-specific DNA recombinase
MARKSRKPEATTQTVTEIQEIVYDTGVYVRLSVMDSGKKDGESIFNQQEMLAQYITERPEFALKRIFVDNGETGVDFLRPAWNDLIAECRAGRINCVIVKDLSRVGRNYIETGEYLEKIFPLLGVRLIAVNDDYDGLTVTNSGQLVANLKNLINDIYAKDISRKVSAALHTKQKNGDFIGNHAAYGYLKDPHDKNKIVVDTETAPIVRQIFTWKAEGVGNAQICRRLNDSGIPCPSRYRLLKGIVKDKRYEKCLWEISPLTKILENPVYLGNMVQGKHIGSLSDGKPRSRAKAEDWIIVEGTHEAIITQELFDKARAVMAERSAAFKAAQGKYAHFEKSPLLLKDLVFCADCGRPLYRYKSVICKGKYCDWIYLCRTSESLKSCPQKYIHEPDLYNAVYAALRAEILLACDTAAIIEKLNRESSHKSRLSRFDAEIEEAEREIKRIASLRQGVYEDFASKLLTASEYQFATEKYDADSDRQQARLEAAKHDKAQYSESSTPVNKWLAAFTRFIDAKELTADMAKALIERVEVSNRNRVEVKFKFRDELAAIHKFAESGKKAEVA